MEMIGKSAIEQDRPWFTNRNQFSGQTAIRKLDSLIVELHASLLRGVLHADMKTLIGIGIVRAGVAE